MPKVSTKRQITLPVADCERLGIHPGDEVEILHHGNQINIVKKRVGAAAGMLKGANINNSVSDEESRQANFE
jgi:AbrB family looped-hinge helix DNA binding protein